MGPGRQGLCELTRECNVYLSQCCWGSPKSSDGDEYSQHRRPMLHHLDGVDPLMALASRWMTTPGSCSNMFQHHTDRKSLRYTRLFKITAQTQSGWLQRSTVPKHHLVGHMPDQAEYLKKHGQVGDSVLKQGGVLTFLGLDQGERPLRH